MAKRKYPQELYDTRIRPRLDAMPGTNRDKERAMGLPDKIIYNWSNAGYGSWADYLHTLSAYLNVSIAYLTGESDDPDPEPVMPRDGVDASIASLLQTLRDEDRTLLEVARGMTPEQVKRMAEFARSMKGET